MRNSAYKFKGRVVAVGKTERMGRDPSRPFFKRTLVVDDAEDGAKYPNPVPFEATGEERCAALDSWEKAQRMVFARRPAEKTTKRKKDPPRRKFTQLDTPGLELVEDGDEGYADGYERKGPRYLPRHQRLPVADLVCVAVEPRRAATAHNRPRVPRIRHDQEAFSARHRRPDDHAANLKLPSAILTNASASQLQLTGRDVFTFNCDA